MNLRSCALACVVLGVTLASCPTGMAAQVRPDAEWRTLTTEHFRVTFAPGLEALARHAAARAEVARDRLSTAFTRPPAGMIDILIADDTDYGNGAAMPFPSNRIVIFAQPPVGERALGFHEDWIDLVVTHELVHAFHLDRAGGFGGLARRIFGRVPSPWPLFPVVFTPNWSIEGLATYFESALTGAGRVHGTHHDMIVRTAVLEDAFPPIDRAEGLGPTWPAGQSRYVFGSLFMDYIARTHGADALGEIVDRTASAWLPPTLAFDRVATNATGRSFTELWGDWRDELEQRYAARADSVRALGVTASERLTDGGYFVARPRVSPDGGRLAYAAANGRDEPATRVLDLTSGRTRTVAERNEFGSDLGPASWLPDGAGLLAAQFEFDGPNRVLADLYRIDVDGGETRLTNAARLAHPDVSPDGRRVVAVRKGGGTSELVLYDLRSGSLRALTEPRADVHWNSPRWAPDGRRIAAERWRPGALHDVVVLDTTGALLFEPPADRALDLAPAWSPDGRFLVFSSDRTGVTNLYAYDRDGELHQISNVLTGAFDPEVSPDGHWLYFVAYHADGYAIERMPFDPESWRVPQPARPAVAAAGGAFAGAAGPIGAFAEARDSGDAPPAALAVDSAAVRAYSPVWTLRPHFWLPIAEPRGLDGAAGSFFGFYTFGEDLVGRHEYDLSLAVDPRERRAVYDLAYAYAGLGNPILRASVSREWDGAARRHPDAGPYTLLEDETAAALSASLLHPRWRRAAALTFGAELARRRARLVETEAPLRLADPLDRFYGVFGRLSYASQGTPAFAISRESGGRFSVAARRRWDRDPFVDGQGTLHDASYREASAEAALYHDVHGFGFADHVLAARVAAVARSGPGASTFGAGGASDSPRDIVFGESVGGASIFLPARGHPRSARGGTRGWSASLEYRFPLLLVDRGRRVWPAFLDRVSGALFADAADAGCATGAADDRCREGPPLVGAGAELSIDLDLVFEIPIRLRGGVGVPVHGAERREPVLYLRFGPSF